jgi:hypothetical protein
MGGVGQELKEVALAFCVEVAVEADRRSEGLNADGVVEKID